MGLCRRPVAQRQFDGAQHRLLIVVQNERQDLHHLPVAAGLLGEADEGPPLPPLSPGEVLNAKFMVPAGITARALGAELGVPGNRITGIINGTRAVTAATAILLERRFGTSAEFWLKLQAEYELAVARAALGQT